LFRSYEPTPEFNFIFRVTLEDNAAVPLPGALPLFAGGLGVLGLLGWRRRRRA
jgi:putative exporter of polyketide antibiotics